MIVCSCSVFSDHDILYAVARGITWKQLVREKKLASSCGRCAFHARTIFEQAKAGTYVPLVAAPAKEIAFSILPDGAGAGTMKKEK